MALSDMGMVGRAFTYLRERAADGVPFTVYELAQASGWTALYAKTNIQKRLGELVIKKHGKYHAIPNMLRVRYGDFVDLFRQKQRLFTDYKLKITPYVLIYEFFLPLSKEDKLREALDNLFFRDSIIQRTREIGITAIKKGLQLDETLTDEAVNDFVCSFASDTIGGYSLYLVNGRFRADTLMTRHEAAQREITDGPYLMDETTAVVRFILPVPSQEPDITQQDLFEPAPVVSSPNETAERIRWLFLHFFAEAVVHVVNKEEEIWLLETGFRTALYRWIKDNSGNVTRAISSTPRVPRIHRGNRPRNNG